MLSLVSRLKSYLWRRFYSRHVDDMYALLKYPHDDDEVDAYIDLLDESLGDYYRDCGERTSTLTITKLKYRILNSKNLFLRSLKVYEEILRRETRLTSIFRLAGFRKFLWSRFVLSDHHSGYKFSLFKYFNEFFPGFEKGFEKKVAGKVVAIVGGAPSSVKNGKSIDSCDLVARININSLEKFDPEILGERIDIVYVRGERGEAIQNNDIDYFESRTDSSISYRLKVPKHLDCFPPDSLASVCLNFDEVFDYGHLNAVQTAILDLLIHGASLVKVYNVDFNMSGQSFKGYRPRTLADVNYSKIFASHPPHPQFQLCKSLNSIGLIDGDDVFMSIINMELREFSDECQRIWAG